MSNVKESATPASPHLVLWKTSFRGSSHQDTGGGRGVSPVQERELEHNAEQAFPASSQFSVRLLSSRGQRVWLAGRAGCLSWSRPILPHEICSSCYWPNETSTVSWLLILPAMEKLVFLIYRDKETTSGATPDAKMISAPKVMISLVRHVNIICLPFLVLLVTCERLQQTLLKVLLTYTYTSK